MVFVRGGARGLDVRPRGLERATADLDGGADHEQPAVEVCAGGPQSGGTEPVGRVPLADREQRLDLVRHQQRGLVDPLATHASSPALPEPRRLSRASELHQRVGEVDVSSLKAEPVADVLGQTAGPGEDS